MKSKIFKAAVITLMATMPFIKGYAQQTAPVDPVPPVAPAPMTPMTPMMTMGTNGFYIGKQDTAYANKMKELNAKMRDLQKQMNEVRQEALKRQMAARAEVSAKQREAAIAMAHTFQLKPMKTTGFYGNDKDLEDKIKSGQVKEKLKSYTKSYAVDKNDKVTIDNTYGKITINTWAKNEVKVDVDIRADADNDDKAQKVLDLVTIKDNKDAKTIAFATTIDRSEDNSWGTWSNNSSYSVRKVIVNYTVYMPAKNALQINNKFGAIDIPDFDGQLTINNTYGNFNGKNLTNTSNIINTKYGGVNIANLKGGSLDVAYGDGVDLGTSENVKAEIRYAPMKIGKLSGTGTIAVRYGNGISIKDMDNVKNLSISSDFAPVYLTVGNKLNCDFDVSVQYNEFIADDSKVKVTSKSPSDDDRRYSSSKNYKGYIGKSNTDNKITVTSRYQSVVFQ